MKKYVLPSLYGVVILAFIGLTAVATWLAVVLLPGSAATSPQYQLAYSLQTWVPMALQLIKWFMLLFWLVLPASYTMRHAQTHGLANLYRSMLYAHSASVVLVLLTLLFPVANGFAYLHQSSQFILGYCLPLSLLSPLFVLYKRRGTWDTGTKNKQILWSGTAFAVLQLLFVALKYLHSTRETALAAAPSQVSFLAQSSLLQFIDFYQSVIIYGVCGIAWFFLSVFALRKHGLHVMIKSLLVGFGLSFVLILPIALFATAPNSFYWLSLIRQESTVVFTSSGCFSLLVRSSIMAFLSTTLSIATADKVFEPQPWK